MDATSYIEKANSSLYSLITNELSNQSSKRYNNEKFTLIQLDEWRRDTLPKELFNRYNKHNKTWLEKEELVLLMDWKLAKGKFRPILPKLIKSNSEKSVKDVTMNGFGIFLDYISKLENEINWQNSKDRKEYIDVVKKSFKKITELRGVGPATASLILSLLADINNKLAPPFFSDESFIYLVVDRNRPDTKIKYTIKEYTDELIPIYFEILQKDKNLNMYQIEKGCWALKMYDIYKIDKLIDIKLPFEINDECLKKYCGEQNNEEENNEPPKKKKKSVK